MAKIVDQASACLNWDREERHPMLADHSEICKFDNDTDVQYLEVILCLQTFVRKAVEMAKASKALVITTRDLSDLGGRILISFSS